MDGYKKKKGFVVSQNHRERGRESSLKSSQWRMYFKNLTWSKNASQEERRLCVMNQIVSTIV